MFNRLDKFVLAGKAISVVTLRFVMPQNPSMGPLSMQWATHDTLWVIPACTSLWWKVRLVYWKPPAAVEQWMSVRIGPHRLVKVLEYESHAPQIRSGGIWWPYAVCTPCFSSACIRNSLSWPIAPANHTVCPTLASAMVWLRSFLQHFLHIDLLQLPLLGEPNVEDDTQDRSW